MTGKVYKCQVCGKYRRSFPARWRVIYSCCGAAMEFWGKARLRSRPRRLPVLDMNEITVNGNPAGNSSGRESAVRGPSITPAGYGFGR